MQPTLEDRVEALESNVNRIEAGTIKAVKDIKATMATKGNLSVLEAKMKGDISRLERKLDDQATCMRAMRKADQVLEALKRQSSKLGE